MADQALTVGGAGTGASAPLAYTVPGTGEIILKGAFARMDGTGAAGSWFPCLRVKTPNGSIMLECIGDAVAAGASADVSWFPGLGGGGGGGGSGIQSLNAIFNGRGTFLQPNLQLWFEIDFAATITEWRLAADTSGSIVIDIWKKTFSGFPPTVANSICAASLPTLSSQQINSDTVLSGWTTSIATADMLLLNINSCTGITVVDVALSLLRTG